MTEVTKAETGADSEIKPTVTLGGASTAKTPAVDPLLLKEKLAEDDVPDEETAGCEVDCAFVFISSVPGSTVLINGTTADGLKRDVFSITFSPVGERKPHPIILDCLYTDFGMFVTDDPKLAHVLVKSIAKGNAQYFHYCADDPSHVEMFQPEVYAIATPDMAAKAGATL